MVAVNIIVTGLSGFLGSRIAKNYHGSIRGIGRYQPVDFQGVFFEKNLDGGESYTECFESQGVIIHCAARAHIMKEELVDSLAEYRRVNVDGTLNLAMQAADAGVKRFIYISSIKVNGESTSGSVPFTEKDTAKPLDPYGVSKYEAEKGLKKIAADSDMEVVIIRPPLIYGAGVKANFLNLLKLSNIKFPLPFGLIKNKRSMVYVENLVDFIVKCIDHPAAANQTFLVSDNHDLSLHNLLVLMRKSMGQSSKLVPVPVFLFNLAGYLFRKKDVVDRLVGDLQVNPSKAMTLLDWKPPYTVEQGMQNTVGSFLEDNKKDKK